MKITFVGLSCFFLESSSGSKLLLDPYKDSPKHSLGINFPSNLHADLFLVSHPDDDHSYLTAKMIYKRRDSSQTGKNPNLFPNLNLKGTLVHEFNGDLNIAFSFTIDDIRFLHLADNSHVLTHSQIQEIGPVDIIFISPPKIPNQDTHIQNIKLLKPKIAILSHYIPPKLNDQAPKFSDTLKSLQQLKNPNITNPNLNDKTIQSFTHMFQYGLDIQHHFPHYQQIFNHTVNIEPNNLPNQTTIYFFRQCLGK